VTQPTNMIFFMSDNHNRDFLGAIGHPVVQTPTLDKIARSGACFANAYSASPLCCPARAALATGRYPHQTGFWDNALAYDGTIPTWHARVREQGHRVSSVGKLHFASGENDNGFSEEIIPMHIVEGKGALIGLLRATPAGVPPRSGPKAMYDKSGVGEADYQRYDLDVTKHAVRWLQANAQGQDKPWVLLVSYASPHPPFSVPKRLYDLYPERDMPLPVQFTADARPGHPAIAHVRHVDGFEQPVDEAYVRRTVAGYCGLITHLDEQIGEVMTCAENLGILDTTRILYTSDHGEAAGNHGLFGKSVLYEHSIGVPLLMSGPGIAAGTTVSQIASHVDLFPTVVESVGGSLAEDDDTLPGVSLWPALGGVEQSRVGFAEFHAQSSKSASYMIRDDTQKLIYHVGMPHQRFDLDSDPQEVTDLDQPNSAPTHELERHLREVLDPEATNAKAMADQLAHAERHGGLDTVRARGAFSYTPVPGDDLNLERV
jgi:choline-sulfatase